MYPVSSSFRRAMKSPVQHFRLRGTIRLTGGAVYSFTEKNIRRDSFNLINQCSGDDNIELGTVYTGELSTAFIGLSLPRTGYLKDAIITPQLGLLTEDGFQDIPLGVFWVKQADWTNAGVEVTAYDAISKLEKAADITLSEGYIHEFLSLACTACGVELGMTQAEIRALPNANTVLELSQENDIETWRDLVYWCAQTTATFATADRAGKLVLRTYSQISSDTIDTAHRYAGGRLSDFLTRYTEISVVNVSDIVNDIAFCISVSCSP